MTVSRALSDNPNVTQATRETVQQRAKELGYVKSAAARAMRGDASKIIGLLLPNITNEFYAQFANTLAQACDQASYHLVIHLTNDNIEVERQAIAKLREVQAQAVIMVPSPVDTPKDTQDDKLVYGDMDVVQLIRQRDIGQPCKTILVEDDAAIAKAVSMLAAQGHQRIGYIGADQTLSSGKHRLEAFVKGFKNTNTAPIDALIHTDSPSFQAGFDSAQQLIQSQVNAIVCGGFEISNGALSAFMSAYDDTRDIAFIGYGNPPFYNWIRGGLSTIDIPVDDLAVDALSMIIDNQQSQTVISHSASLLVRNS